MDGPRTRNNPVAADANRKAGTAAGWTAQQREILLSFVPDYEDLPDGLDPPQAAKILHLKTQTLAAARCTDPQKFGLVFFKAGRRVIYSKASIAAYILSRCNVA